MVRSAPPFDSAVFFFHLALAFDTAIAFMRPPKLSGGFKGAGAASLGFGLSSPSSCGADPGRLVSRTMYRSCSACSTAAWSNESYFRRSAFSRSSFGFGVLNAARRATSAFFSS